MIEKLITIKNSYTIEMTRLIQKFEEKESEFKFYIHSTPYIYQSNDRVMILPTDYPV